LVRFSISSSSPLLSASVVALLRDLRPEATVDVNLADAAEGGVRVELDGSGRWLYIAPMPEASDDAVTALSEGALAVLHLASATDDFERGLEALIAGDRGYVPVDVAHWMATRVVRNETTTPSTVTLTQREREVLERVALGYSNSEIAQELSISVNTVRTHLNAMALKLDANGRTRMLAKARALAIPEANAGHSGHRRRPRAIA
jgi:DNA-binding CsgD family transcriptional regulator